MPKMTLNVADPKENVRQRPHTAGVGNETKADMSVVGTSSLKGAMAALEGDLKSGNAHMPLHGLRPTGKM